MRINDHPQVQEAREAGPPSATHPTLDELKRIGLEAGADDVGWVSLERPALAEEKIHATRALPGANSLLSFVVRMNRDAVRTVERGVANAEFHHGTERVTEVGHRIVRALEHRGVRALNPAAGFPMEMDRWPSRLWTIAHKTVAVEAGLGAMGIHRNVIHPKFGNFILLGTVVLDLDLDGQEGTPIDFNPCLSCKLCVAACPVGAIKTDGAFDFASCYTHNYREFMGGFSDWIEQVADSRSAKDYRERVEDKETVSMWQSLGFGPNYKAAYCMAVCPAGSDVIAPFVFQKKRFLAQVVRPLQAKAENVYVTAGSDAEAHAKKRFPHKTVRRVGNGLRVRDTSAFLAGLPLLFQREKAKALELDASFHFTFRNAGKAHPNAATVEIRKGALTVHPSHQGEADVHVDADAAAWLGALAGERSMVWAVIKRQIKVRGPLALLKKFEACFPS